MSYRHIVGCLLIFVSFGVQAQSTTTTTVVEKRIVTSPPKGQCTTVPGHWVDSNTWADAYTQCTYENRTEGSTYISDYWSCTAATADGTCTSWVFVPGHWVKS